MRPTNRDYQNTSYSRPAVTQPVSRRLVVDGFSVPARPSVPLQAQQNITIATAPAFAPAPRQAPVQPVSPTFPLPPTTVPSRPAVPAPRPPVFRASTPPPASNTVQLPVASHVPQSSPLAASAPPLPQPAQSQQPPVRPFALPAAPLTHAKPNKRTSAPPVSRPKLAAMMSAVAVVGTLMVLSGAGLMMNARSLSMVRISGRGVAVGVPVLRGTDLQSSCYDLALPLAYKVTSAAGCSVQIEPVQTTQAYAIRISSAPVASSVPLKVAPDYLMTQASVGTTLDRLTNVTKQDIQIDGIKAVQLTYQIENGRRQAITYATNLPARYMHDNQPVGSIAITGYYDTQEAQQAFESVVSSLRWVR